ncbi:MAG: ABC transporter ATP-binding protein [Clostridia bacterium]|jgi:spermidine/putrescine transport system ATP-binding protein|nr:ABC transporter ATP-binding protein [Clostridiaceae bacterium]
MSDYIIELKNVTKIFEDGFVALDNLNLSIKKNEFLTLLGPSGCGKTTTLRIIGGFETPTKGDVIFQGQRINDLPPHKRKVNTVFQKYALFTHLNVFDNVAFGLKISKTPKNEIKERVTEMLALVNLHGFEERQVESLSGGQQQRVAIARALVNRPDVLLLDEPLGALDLKMRKEMQIELKKMQEKLGITFVYVTHDQEEALSMSDSIVILKDGIVQQIGDPVSIYNEPKNAFVADFIGESNILDGTMVKDKLVRFCNKDIPCIDTGFEPNEPIDVVIRPEDIDIVKLSDAQWTGKVLSVVFKGVHYDITVESPDGFIWLIQNTDRQYEGDTIGMSVDPENIHIMKKVVVP